MLLGAAGLSVALASCASETAAYHRSRAEDHVYVGPKRSFLERAARLLSEVGQSPQLDSPNVVQTRWVLASGAPAPGWHGAEPLVFQCYRATITSLDDLHHRMRFERGSVTTFDSPAGPDPNPQTAARDPSLPGAVSGLPSVEPGSTGVPVFTPEGDLEWEFLRRTDPDAAALIEQERAAVAKPP
ncbi:MAG TPA: hypothetical protein VMH40_19935 [Myxococcaceae bacterium]|nr:hypothetical protein [Myxococcaceae bacterium]